MIDEKDKEKLKNFLKKYPSPSVEVVTTLHKNRISCFGAVPTICGAGIYVRGEDYRELMRLIKQP